MCTKFGVQTNEINSTIEGFGYQKDPRIEEIRNKRNVQEDLPILFGCEKSQIATNANEVNEKTVAYIGPLYPNIFKQLPSNIEHVYTKFPEGKILIKEIEIPKEIKSAEQYEKELTDKEFFVYDWAKDILSKADLKQGAGQKIKIVIPTVASLGFPNGATRQEIQNAAKNLGIGLKPLPARAGPELRLQYPDQPNGEYILIDMENITDRGGSPSVFSVDRGNGGRRLRANDSRPDYRWSGYRWAFLQD